MITNAVTWQVAESYVYRIPGGLVSFLLRGHASLGCNCETSFNELNKTTARVLPLLLPKGFYDGRPVQSSFLYVGQLIVV
jgi:hypothetical protein